MTEIVSRRDFGPDGFRWLTLTQIMWRDPTGRLRKWESAERSTRASCGVDGVVIVAHVTGGSAPPRIILEAQFRPPQGNVCIELPAGLIDEGESAAEAAVRELNEETGYSGTVGRASSVCFSDPGLTNANMQFVDVHVDADAPENADVHPELEDGEFIEVFLEPEAGLYDRLLALQQEKGWDVDARLMMYAAGLDDGSSAPQQPAPNGAASATAITAAAAGNGVQRVSYRRGGSAGVLPASSEAPAGADSPTGGNGQSPPSAAASPEKRAGTQPASAPATPERQQKISGDRICGVCPHCGHDSTGDGLVASAVRGLSRAGSRALLSRAGSAHPPPAVEVAFASPGSLANLRGLDQPAGSGAASEAPDIGQPDALHPRDIAAGPTPLRMSLADLEKAGIESVRIVPRGTLRWRRIDRLVLIVGGAGLLVGAVFSQVCLYIMQVAVGMALAFGLRYHPNHRLNWSN